jgi:hypothetical protein
MQGEQRKPINEEFALEEYKILRERASDMVRRIDQLERNVVIACSAIFVFALSGLKLDEPVPRWILYFMPLFVSAIGVYKYTGLSRYLRELNQYVAEIELKLNGGEPAWLNRYYNNSNNNFGNSHFRRYRVHLWTSILIFNSVIGLVLSIAR